MCIKTNALKLSQKLTLTWNEYVSRPNKRNLSIAKVNRALFEKKMLSARKKMKTLKNITL